MSHSNGLFVNDLFNGEALSGGPEGSRGIFRKNLFDGEPLGQTTPDVSPASDTLISQLATSGGKTATASPIDKSGTSPQVDPSQSAYSPYATATMPVDYGASTSSDIPWVPIALIGGAVLLTVGFVVM